jgi:hypothetical protein
LDLASYAWAGFGGGITILVWKNRKGGLFDLYEIGPEFIISIGLIILFSLLDQKPAAK